ncbi:MAG TPA: response regulator [Planctomycetota bacterium]|jgi:two-component system, cell cycle response regulator DivK|nr:response regulator [Planctomycetota bacterium]
MKTIAVVEDNADNRLLLRAFLADAYEIVEYETGMAALEAFASMRPDLILLDVSLPGMDGLAVLSRVRGDERLKKLPVIALTAHAMHGDRERFLKAGFDDYVSKPIVDEQVLLDAIRRLLERA